MSRIVRDYTILLLYTHTHTHTHTHVCVLIMCVCVQIELLCRGTPLRNETALSEVWKELWNSGEDDLQLTYHRRC